MRRWASGGFSLLGRSNAKKRARVAIGPLCDVGRRAEKNEQFCFLFD
jgi:hypothetical protein